MHLEAFQLFSDRGAAPRQEARAHPIGRRSETQVETGGLNLPTLDRDLGGNPAGFDPIANCLARHDAGGPDCLARGVWE